MSAVQILKDAVVKRREEGSLEVEAAKMIAAKRISLETGAFRVPAIHTATAGVLRVERIPAFREVRSLSATQLVRHRLARRIGVALAVLHNRLVLPSSLHVDLPAWLDHGSGKAYLHGDFSGANVGISGDNYETPVFVDWQMTQIYGGKATYGTGMFDVCWFVNNLFSQPLLKHWSRITYAQVAEEFIDGYLSERKLLHRTTLDHYHRQFCFRRVNERRATSSWFKQLLLSVGEARWRRFVQQ